ncbi:MAG: CDP-diacylglycerol-choline O-phosphatidyltransferase [Tardiphaga sp.]|nr:CDP-diacylglycerol-choline O-phosphatidyltransferase [Tardiphaga sp.]
MTPLDHQQASTASRKARAAAFSVHILTALGAGVALAAMLEAVREHWAAMFGWLGIALIIDGIDGPLARHLDVARLQPDWSGDTLDLVVDFLTYVFVPAYAICASHLLLPIAAPLLGAGIVVTSALYFADRRMKTEDNHFRGFPALWNAAAFYLFLLQPSPGLASLCIAALIVLTFVPFRVIHPFRTKRLRPLTLTLIALWAALAVFALYANFEVSVAVTLSLCAIAVYFVGADAILRLLRRISA